VSTTIMNAQAPLAYQRRVDRADWSAIAAEVDELGCALTPQLLTAADTARLIRLYDHDEAFRSTVHMGKHGAYGQELVLSAARQEDLEQLPGWQAELL